MLPALYPKVEDPEAPSFSPLVTRCHYLEQFRRKEDKRQVNEVMHNAEQANLKAPILVLRLLLKTRLDIQPKIILVHFLLTRRARKPWRLTAM